MPPGPPDCVQTSVGSLEVSQVQPEPLMETMVMFGSTMSVRVTGVTPSVGDFPEFVRVSV